MVPTPAEVVPPRPTQSEALMSERESNPGDADGAIRSESDDTTSAAVSFHSSASTPSPDIIHGARQAGPASFRPSHAVRPPMLLDTAICVLLVLVFALLCRRVF